MRWKVAEIYLPLSRLLNFYISSNLRRQAVTGFWALTASESLTSSVSRAKSVAVGKEARQRAAAIAESLAGTPPC